MAGAEGALPLARPSPQTNKQPARNGSYQLSVRTSASATAPNNGDANPISQNMAFKAVCYKWVQVTRCKGVSGRGRALQIPDVLGSRKASSCLENMDFPTF